MPLFTLLQSNSGGFGTASANTITSSAVGFSSTTTAGSLLVMIVWSNSTHFGLPLVVTPATSGLTWLRAGVGEAFYVDFSGSPVYADASIFYCSNAPSIASSVTSTATAAEGLSTSTQVEFALLEIAVAGGGQIAATTLSGGPNPGLAIAESADKTGTPPNNSVSPTTTSAIISALRSETVTAFTAGTGFTLGPSSSHVTKVGQSLYALNEPAGTIPVAFAGTSTLYGMLTVAFAIAPIKAFPTGVSGTGGVNTPTTFISASVSAAGVRAACAIGAFSVPQPGPGLGSFEVRLSDDGWGCDNGGNLVGRFTSQKFSIPRIKRNQVIFVKLQDGRNNMLSSEVWVNGGGSTIYQSGIWTSTVDWSRVQALDENYNLKLINTKVMVPGDTTVQTTPAYLNLNPNISYSASIDIKGPVGNWVTMTLTPSVPGTDGISAVTTAYKLTGQWQRITVFTTATGAAVNLTTMAMTFTLAPGVGGANGVPGGYTFPSGGITIFGSRASLEQSASETIYCKTIDNGVSLATLAPYGALSRYASSIRCGYPFAPNPPTGFCDPSDPGNPVVNLILPSVADDVWGVEIRAADNTTVLYHDSLTDASYAPTYTVVNNKTRNLNFYLYTYNLLGEYSTGYQLTVLLPTPVASGLSVNASTLVLSWSGSNAPNYTVEVDDTSNLFTHDVVNQTQTGTSTILTAGVLTHPSYFRVTPFDDIGPGTPITATYA